MSNTTDPHAALDWARLLPKSLTRSVSSAVTEADGRPALRVELLEDISRNGTADMDYVDMPTFVELPIAFGDGVIEVDITAEDRDILANTVDFLAISYSLVSCESANPKWRISGDGDTMWIWSGMLN